jgi:putative ABC transport system permease protein
MKSFDDYLMSFLDDWKNVVGLAVVALLLVLAVLYWQYFRLMLKSLARAPLRTSLTSVVILLFVFVITLVWSILWLLDLVTTEKSNDFKALVTERWQLPSQMPFSYAAVLKEGAASKPGDVKPLDDMTWQFFGGTLDEKHTRENLVFFFCLEPEKILSMLDGMSEMSPEDIAKVKEMIRLMNADKRRIVLGKDRAKLMNKKAGDRISLFSINYKDINLDDCEIIGVLPEGRWNQSAFMHRDRLNGALDDYERRMRKKHPLADRSLNLVALKMSDSAMYNKVAEQILETGKFLAPAVKVETWSSGVASFLDAYRDFLTLTRWVLVPVMILTIAVVIANAIGISVRERRTEMAILKVLGFGPNVILILVLGEAILLGALSGFVSSALTYLVVNQVFGGIKFPIGFFPDFRIPTQALWWGPLLGAVPALVGSILPAWGARSVRVSEVFAKVT